MDLTDYNALEYCEQFIHQMIHKRRIHSLKQVPHLLIGTKYDVKSSNSHVEEMHLKAMEFAKKQGLAYMVTSSKTNEGVSEAFIELIKKGMKQRVKQYALMNRKEEKSSTGKSGNKKCILS